MGVDLKLGLMFMRLFFCVLIFCSGIRAASANAELLQRGFDQMYNLSFPAAHGTFEQWQKLHPENPEGPVFNAAAYLFSEFDRLKVLQSQFFVENQRFVALKRLPASPEIRAKFEEELSKSKKLADMRLSHSPGDESALFADVLRLGLHADYLALIERQDLAALGEIKQATQEAESLLQRDPGCYDAYIASGIENYLLSLKPAPVRWFLHVAGAQTDRQVGVDKLRLTATKGQYLQPYAELLLAVAALRDKDVPEARRLLSDLSVRFPQNPLYRQELEKLR